MRVGPSREAWWGQARHLDRRPALLLRNQIRRTVRAWFEAEGFTEVECGALQASPGNETHLHAFATHLRSDDGRERRLYLHTSPEFACKKLLAAGETRIFDFARVFRNREEGALHAPEFTMLEWYRTAAPYTAVIADAVSLSRLAQATGGRGVLRWRDRTCDAQLDPEWLTLTEAFARFAGMANAPFWDRSAFAAQAAAAGHRPRSNESVSDLFSRILVEHVEPRLGEGRLTVLYRYPIEEAALARPCADDPRFAERFELYACAVELANGFGELTDPDEQRRRFEADMLEKERLYGERYPVDEAFLEALAHMPPASGVALGFDRLVMLAVHARSIEDVLWTPPQRLEGAAKTEGNGQ
jgi:lysyl-tRNA synthetase class 2